MYADHRELDQDESADLLPALDADVMESMALYGQAKVACEQHLRDLVGAERYCVYLANAEGDELVPIASEGVSGERLLPIAVGDSRVGQAFRKVMGS